MWTSNRKIKMPRRGPSDDLPQTIPVDLLCDAAGVPDHRAATKRLVEVQNVLWGAYVKTPRDKDLTPYASAEVVLGLLPFLEEPEVRDAVQVAISRFSDSQQPAGGWYDDTKAIHSDTTGAVLLALMKASDRGIGWPIAKEKGEGAAARKLLEIVRLAVPYLLDCQTKRGGFFAQPVSGGDEMGKVHYSYWCAWALKTATAILPARDPLQERISHSLQAVLNWCDDESAKTGTDGERDYFGLEIRRGGRLPPIASIWAILLYWRLGKVDAIVTKRLRRHLENTFERNKGDWEEWGDQIIEGLDAPAKYNFANIPWAPMALAITRVSYYSPLFQGVMQSLDEVCRETPYTYALGNALESIAFLRGDYLERLVDETLRQRRTDLAKIKRLEREAEENTQLRRVGALNFLSMSLVLVIAIGVMMETSGFSPTWRTLGFAGGAATALIGFGFVDRRIRRIGGPHHDRNAIWFLGVIVPMALLAVIAVGTYLENAQVDRTWRIALISLLTSVTLIAFGFWDRKVRGERGDEMEHYAAWFVGVFFLGLVMQAIVRALNIA